VSQPPPETAGYLIRPAAEHDLDALVRYEVEIAVISFGDEAVIDPALHRKRITSALGKPGEITLVAAARRAPAVPVGWAWLSARTNSLTGETYGNFRSLAVSDGPDRSLIGELLMAEVLRAADDGGMKQLTGKVHAANLGMRALYRKFGFTATHLTMERRPAGHGTGQHGTGQHGTGQHGTGQHGTGQHGPGTGEPA
jgi:L-amino acid N-acyltransferase YncA